LNFEKSVHSELTIIFYIYNFSHFGLYNDKFQEIPTK